MELTKETQVFLDGMAAVLVLMKDQEDATRIADLFRGLNPELFDQAV